MRLPAGIAGLVMASVPLFTFFLAMAHRLEPFRWRGLAGAVVAIGGIAILLNAPLGVEIHIASFFAMMMTALAAAESGVVIKKFPPSHPLATNGIAMGIGGVLLLALSAVAREPWVLPETTKTWLLLGHLVFLGSIGLFALYLFVLKRWTASGASYQFVLMPIVTILLAAWLAGETISTGILIGGGVVLAGVYVGALSHGRAQAPAPPEKEALAQRCSNC